jgi:hypothetical protein
MSRQREENTNDVAMAGPKQPDRQTSGPIDRGHHVFRVNGPITVHHVNTSGSYDGIAYYVFWESLDEHGNVIPGINKNPSDAPMSGGHMRPSLIPGAREANRMDYKPPFKNPNGWRVHITIPEQEAYSAISNRVYMHVTDPSGPLHEEHKRRPSKEKR